MSKEAALRAMREARYAQRTTGATTAPGSGAPARATKPAKATPPAKQAKAAKPAEPAGAAAPDESAAGDELCGHRSMNGRTCTREKGHAAKSHRYS